MGRPKLESIKCTYCKTSKLRSEFYLCNSRSTGVTPRCKECCRKHDYQLRRGFSLHKQCLKKLGNKCARCGFSDIRALQIDHVNGGGKKEIQSFKGQWRQYYRFVLADNTGRYQCLCANCNWIKKSENREGVRQ